MGPRGNLPDFWEILVNGPEWLANSLRFGLMWEKNSILMYPTKDQFLLGNHRPWQREVMESNEGDCNGCRFGPGEQQRYTPVLRVLEG